VAGEVDIPDVEGGDLEATRISGGEETEQEAEGLEVPEHEVPEVTFPIFPSKEDLGKASDDD
jgi:hypothetical protein